MFAGRDARRRDVRRRVRDAIVYMVSIGVEYGCSVFESAVQLTCVCVCNMKKCRKLKETRSIYITK
jgi:hypothetical protein